MLFTKIVVKYYIENWNGVMLFFWAQILVFRDDYIAFEKTSVRWQKEAEKYGISIRVFRPKRVEHTSGNKWVEDRGKKIIWMDENCFHNSFLPC